MKAHPHPTAAPDDLTALAHRTGPLLFGKANRPKQSDCTPPRYRLTASLRQAMREHDAKNVRFAIQQDFLREGETYGWQVEYVHPHSGYVTTGSTFRYRDMALDWMQQKQERIAQGITRVRTKFHGSHEGMNGQDDPLARSTFGIGRVA